MIAKCPNCGSQFEPETDSIFINCKFCNASIFVTSTQTGNRYILKPTISPDKAELLIAEYLKKNEYTGEVKILGKEAVFYPFYRENQKIELLPAIHDSNYPILSEFKFKGGELTFITDDQKSNYKLLEPEIEFKLGKEKQLNLILYPLILIKYSYLSAEYSLVIDAFSQEVFADILPVKRDTLREKIYMYLFIITSFVLFLEFYSFESVLIGIILNIATISIIWFLFPSIYHLIEDTYVSQDQNSKMP